MVKLFNRFSKDLWYFNTCIRLMYDHVLQCNTVLRLEDMVTGELKYISQRKLKA